ncbi:hypothetical protein DPMN_094195 [Dreissena polymorpha]|uniref:Uncharacterized protein n=1 Tax=Dreissena polymorpha TaxID=45954 RepID=A0A9D4L779_DREPO|nr:hypothetical protein DPMN_094195 [Dreissena polymorpha]
MVYLQLETKTIQEEDYRSESGWNIKRLMSRWQALPNIYVKDDIKVLASTNTRATVGCQTN